MRTNASKAKKVIVLSILFLFTMIPVLPAQEFPTKPINIVVTNAPSSTPDVLMRMLTSKAEKFLGRPFVITNNGAGAGTVALGIVSKAKPDGYSLVAHTTNTLTWTPLFQTVSYKPEDFISVMHYGVGKAGLAVMADAPFKTLKEFVEYARKNPGKVTYSCTGIGAPSQFGLAYVAYKEGVKMTPIPHGGGQPALMALLGGHVMAMSTGQDWIPYVKEGKLRLLAVYSESRMKIFPEVPTLQELGYEFTDDPYYTVSAPNGTPPSIVKRLDDAFHKAIDDPEFVQLMEKMHIEIAYRGSEEIMKYIEKTKAFRKKTIAETKMQEGAEKK